MHYIDFDKEIIKRYDNEFKNSGKVESCNLLLSYNYHLSKCKFCREVFGKYFKKKQFWQILNDLQIDTINMKQTIESYTCGKFINVYLCPDCHNKLDSFQQHSDIKKDCLYDGKFIIHDFKSNKIKLAKTGSLFKFTKVKNINKKHFTENEMNINIPELRNSLKHYLTNFDRKTTNWKEWNIKYKDLKKLIKSCEIKNLGIEEK